MWITSILLLAVAQGIVNGYRYRTASDSLSDYGEEDIYRDLDYWNKKDERLDTPAKAISAAEHSLAAAKAALQAKQYADKALADAEKAVKAAALAGKHSKMAAHMASLTASRAAAHFSKVAGTRPGSSAAAGRRPGSSAAAGRRPGSSTAAGRRPGSSAAVGSTRPGSSAGGGSKPGSSAAGGKRPGSAAGGRAGARPTISGTPTGSSKGGSSVGGSNFVSFNVVLRFPNFRFTPVLLRSTSGTAIKLKWRMCNAMGKIFRRGEMQGCRIISFKKGSLLANFFLKFRPNVKDAIARIKAAIKSGYFAGFSVQKSPVKVYNVKGAGKSPSGGPSAKPGCKPCKNLAPGVKLVNQSQCPTGYCATLMINPSQVMQAAAPVQPPTYPQMAAQPSYSSCTQMCQPPATQYSCPPSCPPTCCAMGKK